MKNDLWNRIFKKGSVTYYYSSIFFPKEIKQDVFILYGFVRTADDLVDSIPAQKDEFVEFRDESRAALKGKKSKNRIITAMIDLIKRKKINHDWVLKFLESMEMDLTKKNYTTFKELRKYIYGSADVIGLMMARIMELPQISFKYAAKLGAAMQLLNFIRDIDEDTKLGRIYIPLEDREKFGIKKWETKEEEKFEKLVRYEIGIFEKIQKEAEKGYKYIPNKYLRVIKTAAEMYKWSAKKIYHNPSIVWQKKVKPRPSRVVWAYINNFFSVR